jgi:hypothetical protein
MLSTINFVQTFLCSYWVTSVHSIPWHCQPFVLLIFLAIYTCIPLTLYPEGGSRGISDIPPKRHLRYSSETPTFYQYYLAMSNTADVTNGKPIAVWSQSILAVNTINLLVAFYDIHGRKTSAILLTSPRYHTRHSYLYFDYHVSSLILSWRNMLVYFMVCFSSYEVEDKSCHLNASS